MAGAHLRGLSSPLIFATNGTNRNAQGRYGRGRLNMSVANGANQPLYNPTFVLYLSDLCFV